jgi:hypothetical protein
MLRMYPQLRRKYQRLVPHEVSEYVSHRSSSFHLVAVTRAMSDVQDFWLAVYESHFYHRGVMVRPTRFAADLEDPGPAEGRGRAPDLLVDLTKDDRILPPGYLIGPTRPHLIVMGVVRAPASLSRKAI